MNANASGINNGASWADAYTDLQSALGASSCTDVWVKSGIYKPITGADRTATFQLKWGVALYGGFAGTETNRSQRNPAANVTILSGDIDSNDSQMPIITDLTTVTGNVTNSEHVVTGATGATLDGFTITAGNAGGNYGGGMENESSSPTLTNITFIGNSAYKGGGMENYSSSNPTLINVTFMGNSASADYGAGGGMYNFSSSPILANVIFNGNSANYGGGMYNQSSNPTLTNVTFSSNLASGDLYAHCSHGGGMYNSSSNPTLTNVTFSDNSGGICSYGGGMYNSSSNPSSPTIHNTIFWGNTAVTDGTQIYNGGSSSPVVSNSVVQDGYAGGTNIITSDPLLGTLGNYGGFTQTIPLLVGSSAIDTGNNATCVATDQRGYGRPVDGDGNGSAICDIGAYEAGAVPLPTFTPTPTPTLTPTLTPALNSVTGSVLIHGGWAAMGGPVGSTINIDTAFSATSTAGAVTDMRVGLQGSCSINQDLSLIAWEPFVTSKNFLYTIIVQNWVGFYVSVQYRDAASNLSPVYCDDISVEGMPGNTPTPALTPTGLRSIYLPLVLRNYPPPGGAFTPTPSPTPTGGAAGTMTFTPTPTLFPTATATPSSTATLAPTFTPTLTLTPTQTFTSTQTLAPIIPIDGQWVGRTNQDISLGFTVQNNGTQWYFFLVACPGGGYAAGGPGPITNASMSYNDGLITFNGEFTSATYVTGSYDTANCGPGTWWAVPAPTATPTATLSKTPTSTSTPTLTPDPTTLTPTPTPTGTLPTSTITPTPTATLDSGGIVNGDFESGPSVGWTEYSLQGWPVIVSGSGFHGGSYGAWLGGGDDEIGYIEQQVTIPSGAPYLVYWYWIDSEDDCGYDFGRVLINDSEVDAYDLCIDASTGDWVTHSLDLSAYAGQSVTLQIGIETDSSGVSSLYVDDVSFQASAPAPGQIKGIGANTNAFTTQRKIGITTPRKKPYGITPPGLQNSLTHSMHQQTMIPR